DKFLRLGRPFNDVYLFTSEFRHDGRNAHATLADKRANRVNVSVFCFGGNLRAVSRFAGDSLHNNRTVCELGRLGFKELLEEFRVGTGEAKKHAARRLFDAIEIRAHALTLAKALARNLLLIGKEAGRATHVDEN